SPAVSLNIFPNPSSGLFTLSYIVQSRCTVSSEIFDMQGRRIKELFRVPEQYEGNYNCNLDISGLNNGEYLIRTVIGDKVLTRRIILNK
ncbi:MAG TPA: T9SS type A sorting domain-containing protein, partial [Bacteroidia bacterium]|nr:T9SS type A sorting domain-containing protein [Bacteroidia bacterium]